MSSQFNIGWRNITFPPIHNYCFSDFKSTLNQHREFHAKRYQTHTHEISHFAIEMLFLSGNYWSLCIKKNHQRSTIFLKNIDLFHIDGISKKCALLLAVKSAEVSHFNSTSAICLINTTMLDVSYCSRECLDQHESNHMELYLCSTKYRSKQIDVF